ncbi:MAG: S53 family peptidase, partial [Gammaproteobacteria bacterium]
MLYKAVVASAVLGLGTGAALAQPASGRAQVVHTIPAVLAHAHFLAHHNPTATLEVTVGLKLHNSAQLATFLQNVQDPDSPEYRHFLTPQQFTEEYGPSQASVDAVVQYLNAQGIRVRDVSANRLLIHAEGQSAQMEQAFGVTINDYSLNGTTYYASASDPSLPSGLVQSVQSVMGLNDMEELHPMLAPHSVPPHRGKPGGGGGTPAGYSPQQIAAAYNWPSVTSTANGTGEKIAIGTAFSFKASDVTGFWSFYGLPSHTVT